MMFNKYKFSRITISTASIVIFSLLASSFSKPSASNIISDPEEINRILVQNVGNESNFYAYSIALNGDDIYRYMSSTGSNTIAVFFGYSMEGNYSNTNKVLVVTPVDRNHNAIRYVDCLLYNSSNMSFEASSIGSNAVTANSSHQSISSGLAKSYITNFDENPNKGQVKGILLQRSTLDKFIKNNGASVSNSLRLSFGKNESGGMMVIVSSLGASTRATEVEALDASSLCPNNCDIY